jgi:hypothetical protein
MNKPLKSGQLDLFLAEDKTVSPLDHLGECYCLQISVNASRSLSKSKIPCTRVSMPGHAKAHTAVDSPSSIKPKS